MLDKATDSVRTVYLSANPNDIDVLHVDSIGGIDFDTVHFGTFSNNCMGQHYAPLVAAHYAINCGAQRVEVAATGVYKGIVDEMRDALNAEFARYIAGGAKISAETAK